MSSVLWKGNLMPVKSVHLQDDGLLWLINRVAFHPRGYALAWDDKTGNFYLAGNGQEPWVFGGDGIDETHHLNRIKEIMP